MYERYGKAERKARGGLLDEFCVTTGYNRKYAIRLLNGPASEKKRPRRVRGRQPRYGKKVMAVLMAVWEAAGYPWSVRLKALLPNWMPWIRKRYRMSPEIEKQLLAMSARQMDRRLQSRKREQKNWTHVRKLLGWDRYDSAAAVAAVNAVYRQELRIWMNLYLPSVKLKKKVRVGSKLRRVYSPAQTPLERLLASGQADVRRIAGFKRLLATLDPFDLAARINRKLESVYQWANRRLSPKAETSRRATAVEKTRRGKVRKADFSTALGNPATTRDSHFPTARRRLLSGYILNGLTARSKVTFSDGLTRKSGLNAICFLCAFASIAVKTSMLNAISAIAGVALILTVLWETFETIVLPRRVTRQLRLTRVFYRYTWLSWSALARRRSDKKKRESLLSFYGPISLLLLLAVWALSLVVGFALIHYGTGSIFTGAVFTGRFGNALYMSGTTLFTLGLGDITPASPLARFITVLEAGIGFGFLALVIGYLPVLYQSFSRREVTISLLDARAGSPPTAAEMLRRHAGEHGMNALLKVLEDWERWSADLMESHLSYPVLAYFRSQHDNQSWLGSLTAVIRP